MKIYKLGFKTKKDWGLEKTPLFREIKMEDRTKLIPLAGLHIHEWGHIKKESTFDEEGNQLTGQTFDEEGKELTPAEYYDDWAVDVVFDENPKLGGVDPVHLRKFILDPLPKKFTHSIAGQRPEDIVKPL